MRFFRLRSTFLALGLALAFLAFLPPALQTVSHAQAISVNGGSLQGIISDSSGALVPGASVRVAATDTGEVVTVKTDASGFYTVGPLNPGNYRVTVSATGFETLIVNTVIRTATATAGSFQLKVGAQTVTVEVTEGEVQLNTDQPSISGVVSSEQFQSLPVDGRNVLDYAQLQPGVQLQAGGIADGGFDPTKAGYSAVSFSGISGRTTRILLDGQDVTDETVGTTVFNISEGSVGEEQVTRSTADPSTEVTSQGSVLISSKAGTNSFHGEAFEYFQDQRVGDATYGTTSSPFQRNQFGGSVGGPVVRDKLFFFANSERLKQDQSAPVSLGTKFAAIQKAYPSVGSPDRDTYSDGRLDWNGPHSTTSSFAAITSATPLPPAKSTKPTATRITPGVSPAAPIWYFPLHEQLPRQLREVPQPDRQPPTGTPPSTIPSPASPSMTQPRASTPAPTTTPPSRPSSRTSKFATTAAGPRAPIASVTV